MGRALSPRLWLPDRFRKHWERRERGPQLGDEARRLVDRADEHARKRQGELQAMLERMTPKEQRRYARRIGRRNESPHQRAMRRAFRGINPVAEQWSLRT